MSSLKNMTPAQMEATLDGINNLAIGVSLCKKPNKAPEEEKAARSYKRMVTLMTVWFIVMTVATITIPLVFHSLFHLHVENERSGMRQENGLVRYRDINDEVRYATLEELGLTEQEMENDILVVIGLHPDEDIQVAYPYSQYSAIKQKEQSSFMYAMLVAVLCLGGILTARFKTGKPFYQYLDNLQKQHEYIESIKNKQSVH